MKKYILTAIIIIIGLSFYKNYSEVMSFLPFSNFEKSEKNEEVEVDVEIGLKGDNQPITRAMLAKSLAFTKYSKDEINLLENVLTFDDCSQDLWHYKYINAVVKAKLMSGFDENNFKPDDYVTLEQAQYILNQFGEKQKFKLKLNDENKEKPISYALWFDILGKISEDFFDKAELLILATDKEKNVPIGYVVTDFCEFSNKGIELNQYENMRIKVLIKEREIIAVLEIVENMPGIKNAYISNVDEEGAFIYTNGITKKYYYIDDNKIDKSYIGSIADFIILNQNIMEFNIISEKITGKVNLINDEKIVLNNKIYTLDTYFKLYKKIGDKLSFGYTNDIIVGSRDIDFYIKDNKICSGIMKNEFDFQSIRVLLSSELKGAITVSSNNDIEVVTDDIYNSDVYTGKTEVKINFNKDYTQIIPKDINSYIEVKELNKRYYGEIHILKENEDFYVINEVNINYYLASILENQQFNSYADELLKALSVINRSYILSTAYENDLSKHGANIGSSLNNLDYTGVFQNSKSMQNCLATDMLVLNYDGEIVKGNYFLTSGGFTANSWEVWADKYTGEYPSSKKNHLKSKALVFKENELINKTSESEILQFFKDSESSYLENQEKWFRWSTFAEEDSLSQAINSNLKNIYTKYPKYILTLNNGEYLSENISNIGKVKDISVKKRGEGLNLMEIEIVGEDDTILISSDNVIKQIFSGYNFKIKNLQEEISLSSLPSNFFSFEKVEGGYNFYGGGYGHGVGMSLTASEILTNKDYKFDEILKYFYNNATIESFIKNK